MTKPLPHRDVEARATRGGPDRLTTVQRRALASVKDKSLRKVIGELLISSRGSQENFQELEQWFPVQSSDFNGITGLPFREVVWCEVNGEAGKIERGGDGMVVQRLAKGVYRVLVEEGVDFNTPSDFVTVVPRTGEHEAKLQAVAADAEPVTVEGIGSGWEIRLFRNVAESDPIDSFFYLLGGNFVDAAGNTIIGPRGPAGPTHKSLWNGAGAPPAELGDVDDFYVDTESFLFYGPKTEAGWGEGASLVGPEGPQGAPGEDGEDGAPGAKGEPGLVWKGAWSGGTGYQIGDAVERNGSAWIAIKVSLNVEPPNAGYWNLLAEGQVGGGASELKEGEAVEWTGLSEGGGTHTSEEVLAEKSGEGLHRLRLRARASNGNVTEFQLQADDGVVEKNYLAKFIIGPFTKVFMTLTGESDFPQLSSTRKVTQYGLVSALPSKPSKEDECYFIDEKTNAIISHRVYDGEGWRRLGEAPSAKVHKAAGQLVATATITALLFDTEDHDNANLHSVVENTSRLTAPVAGVYSICGSIKWAANGVGERWIAIALNGSAKWIVGDRRAAITNSEATISTQYKLAAGDYVQLMAYQTSGGNLSTDTAGGIYVGAQDFGMTLVSHG